jgi:hypothetical protein
MKRMQQIDIVSDNKPRKYLDFKKETKNNCNDEECLPEEIIKMILLNLVLPFYEIRLLDESMGGNEYWHARLAKHQIMRCSSPNFVGAVCKRFQKIVGSVRFPISKDNLSYYRYFSSPLDALLSWWINLGQELFQIEENLGKCENCEEGCFPMSALRTYIPFTADWLVKNKEIWCNFLNILIHEGVIWVNDKCCHFQVTTTNVSPTINE